MESSSPTTAAGQQRRAAERLKHCRKLCRKSAAAFRSLSTVEFGAARTSSKLWHWAPRRFTPCPVPVLQLARTPAVEGFEEPSATENRSDTPRNPQCVSWTTYPALSAQEYGRQFR